MFSLDFSDALRAEQDASGAKGSGGSRGAAEHGGGGTEAVAAALQLYDLCSPAEDATLSRENLEKVLRRHIGRDDDVAKVIGMISGGSGGSPADRFDFLSYWQGIDRFFADAGGFRQHGGSSRESDMAAGLRRFRDGVLATWRQQGRQGPLAAERLLALLNEIRDASRDPHYWDEVMQAVPNEPGSSLTLLEVAEAVCVWLRDCLKGDAEDSDQGAPSAAEGLTASPQLGASLTRERVRDLQATPRQGLGMELRRAEARVASPSPAPLTPTSSERRPFTASGRRHGGSVMGRLLSDGDLDRAGHPSVDAQRAAELMEIIARSVGPDNYAVHEALHRLGPLQDSLARTAQSREEEVGDLQRTNEVLMQRREEAESELLRVQELYEDAREVVNERDEALRRADALEQEVVELKEHYNAVAQELNKLKARSADVERERMDTQRRDWQWRDRCEHLEQAAETAEGQAKWMRAEIEKQRTQALDASSSTQALKAEVVRLKAQLRAARQAMRSFRGSADEAEECVSLLREQVAAGAAVAAPAAAAAPAPAPVGAAVDAPAVAVEPAPAPAAVGASPVAVPAAGITVPRPSVAVPRPLIEAAPDQPLLERQLQAQQAELIKLRAIRDALTAIRDGVENGSTNMQDDEDLSPRHQQVHHRCRFLETQVKALLKHAQEIEKLLDMARDARLGATASPDVNRRLSIQRVQEEGTVVFNEMSEQLYTLQVQKADADQELRRLQKRVLEQDGQLKAAQQRRDELLAELGAARKKSSGQDSFGLKIGEGRGSEFYMGGDATVTSETRSLASGSPGGVASGAPGGPGTTGSGSDAGGFGFLTRTTSVLQPSPKQVSEKPTVTINQWIGAAGEAREQRAEELLQRQLQGPVQNLSDRDDGRHREIPRKEDRREDAKWQREQRPRAKTTADPTGARHHERGGRDASKRTRDSQREGGENCEMQ